MRWKMPRSTMHADFVASEKELPLARPQPDAPAPNSHNWRDWYRALKHVWPIYLATHVGFLLLTYLVSLFFLDNFSPRVLKVHVMLDYWNRWDTSQFTAIATNGYSQAWRTAFFPLYPNLENVLTFLIHDPFIAGLIIANLATLALFVVLYRLVEEDFDPEHAQRVVFYLAVFPTAFFLVAAYNESLFLCLAVSSFYCMRRSHWWIAGAFGLAASLTRSAGLFLLVPFCYEYLQQHRGKLWPPRFDCVSILCIPAGLAIFAGYCYLRFQDPLAFSRAQILWERQLQFPWQGFIASFTVISTHSILSFDAMHNVIDFSAGILMLLLTSLCFIGPWRFSRHHYAYAFYTAAFYLFLILFPSISEFPLQSLSRLVIELFPAFIVLSTIGKHPSFNLYYLTISIVLLLFMLTQFLMGHWIV